MSTRGRATSENPAGNTGIPIRTERLVLRPFTPDDAPGLHAIQSRPEVARYLYWGPMSAAESRASLEKRLGRDTLAADGDALSLAIDLADGPAMIGDVVLFLRSAKYRQGEVGYLVHPGHAGRGIATEAANAVLRLGFEHFGLHRIEGRCDARNTASAGVLRKLGMRREAYFRQNEYVKDEWTDECVYAVLADEWRARN